MTVAGDGGLGLWSVLLLVWRGSWAELIGDDRFNFSFGYVFADMNIRTSPSDIRTIWVVPR